MRIAHTLEDPYKMLKKELLRLFTPNMLEQLYGIVYAPELSGQCPHS